MKKRLRLQDQSDPNNGGSSKGSILKKNKKYETPKNLSGKNISLETAKQNDSKKPSKLKFNDDLNQVNEVDNWKKYNAEEVNNKGCCNIM